MEDLGQHSGGFEEVASIPRIHGRLAPESAALTFGDKTTTFSQLDTQSNQIANGLIKAGLGIGARVAVLAMDSDDVFKLLFGIAKAGCVFTGINWRLAPAEIRYILENGEVEALFVDGDRHELGLELASEMPAIGLVQSLDDLDNWLATQCTGDPDLPEDPERIFAQLYTSGTTGNPKGVRLANRSFFAVVKSMAAAGDPWIGWRPEDCTLFNIPSFHIGGLWWAMTTLAAGARGVVLPLFDARLVHELVPQFGVSKVCMVPAMIQMTLDEKGAETVDWASLKHLVYGGAPIPQVLLERAWETLDCELVQIYGLTETGNTAVCLRAEDHRHPGLLSAAGRPYPGVELKVIDSSGKPVPAHTIGEVCLRSPANMVEYWRMPEATAATLRDGWVHTGDAGYVDESGFLFICDRIKDMVISAGENIYPAEIESVLASFPGVREAAVLGIPHERWGEQVLALVVKTEDEAGANLRKRVLLDHCRGALADFKVPTRVEFRPPLPRTASGKIKKAELRAPYWEGRSRQVN
ncbi:MAG: long-chain-fatty-acid--CoA ligase [Planctomycetota bacterium]|nr:long-chain-fatty-acid--CoA ligase [Planctomycetota bacterium]MDG2142440.1 long-chain-fatty-acid--CoA ligase [Planctomycetota bacterium]